MTIICSSSNQLLDSTIHFHVSKNSLLHKPVYPEEKQRIEDAGGYVMSPEEGGGAARVGPVGLAISRSMGVAWAKPYGVIPDPDLYERVLGTDDRTLFYNYSFLKHCYKFYDFSPLRKM